MTTDEFKEYEAKMLKQKHDREDIEAGKFKKDELKWEELNTRGKIGKVFGQIVSVIVIVFLTAILIIMGYGAIQALP